MAQLGSRRTASIRVAKVLALALRTEFAGERDAALGAAHRLAIQAGIKTLVETPYLFTFTPHGLTITLLPPRRRAHPRVGASRP